MRGGAYKYEGGLYMDKTSGKEKEGLSAGEGNRETVCSQSHLNKYNFQIQWIILQL